MTIARFIAMLLLWPVWCQAEQKISPEQKAQVEEYFQHSIGAGLHAEDIEIAESNLNGFIEIYLQGKLMYFDINNKLLFIGDIYDRNGTSLTKAKLKKKSIDRLSRLPTVQLILNGGKGFEKVVEFTDPDCPYCRKAHQFFSDNQHAVERHVYFDTRVHPSAQKKVIHILCSANKEQAFNAVYNNQVSEYKYCEEGAAIADSHQQASKEMSVSGTPTFFIGDELIRGFDKQKLADYLHFN